MQVQAVRSTASVRDDRISIEMITSELTGKPKDGPFVTPVLSGWGC